MTGTGSYVTLLLTICEKASIADFNISFNLFGEYANFEEWDIAEGTCI